MSASADMPEGEEYRRGWDAALGKVREILTVGRRYGVLPAAAAMVEVGLLDAEVADQVLSRSAPQERPKEVEGVRH